MVHDTMQRFCRTRLLLGEERFKRLVDSHIAVIGLGAVGGYAVEGLARAGVARLTIVDFDTIQHSNINRQILALGSTIGQQKVHAGRNRIQDINPGCKVEDLEIFADDRSIEQILDKAPDVVIDAIDSLNPKVQVLTAACRRQIKTFSSMGAALRTDPNQIRIDDISATKNCPLARRLRKRLRANNIYTGITCVYSVEPVNFDYQPPANELDTGNPEANRGRKRSTLGSLPTITGIFGLMLANEAIQHICRE